MTKDLKALEMVARTTINEHLNLQKAACAAIKDEKKPEPVCKKFRAFKSQVNKKDFKDDEEAFE